MSTNVNVRKNIDLKTYPQKYILAKNLGGVMPRISSREMVEFRKGFLILLRDLGFRDRMHMGELRKRHPARLPPLNPKKKTYTLSILSGEFPERADEGQNLRQISIFNSYLGLYLKQDQRPILRISRKGNGMIGFEAECPDADFTVMSTFHSREEALQNWAEVFKCLKIVFEIPRFEGEELLKEIPQ
jgi:hypothetical protein